MFTIILALSMPLAFTYPLMKRFTYWPQLFLGITFNYGLILGWTSIDNIINRSLGSVFWSHILTLGYDTIYGYQDLVDDEIIGVKSTSIKFKNHPKKFLFFCYLIMILSLLINGIIMNFNLFYFLMLIFPFAHLFFFQIKNFNQNKIENCFSIFKSNNNFGLLILFILITGKII